MRRRRTGRGLDQIATATLIIAFSRCYFAVPPLFSRCFSDAINQKKSRTFNGIGVRWGGNLKWIGVSGAAAMWRATAANIRGTAAARWQDVQLQSETHLNPA